MDDFVEHMRELSVAMSRSKAYRMLRGTTRDKRLQDLNIQRIHLPRPFIIVHEDGDVLKSAPP